MDGRYITEARTAAASAASAKHLAREDARVLAVIGSGVQARSHIDARHARAPDRRRSASGAATPRACARSSRTVPSVRAQDRSPRRRRAQAVNGADIIALVTASREPVIERGWIKDGAHICAVGACRPDQREMDTALVRDGRLFVDSRIGALAEAGDIVMPIARRSDRRSRTLRPSSATCSADARRDAASPKEITIFKSLGMAVEDVAAARLALERASEMGLGRGFVL